MKANMEHMQCWVPQSQQVNSTDFKKLHETWLGREQKDKCNANMQGKEMAYWRGTEVGLLGGYEFKGARSAFNG